MGTFGKSFKKELGKNTGRWVSNIVFGDGHASKHHVTIQREREKSERKTEREALMLEKESEKEARRQQRIKNAEERRQQKEDERAQRRIELEERRALREELNAQKRLEIQERKRLSKLANDIKRAEIEERRIINEEKRAQKEEEIEFKRWEKEQNRLQKEQEIQEENENNLREATTHQKFIDALLNVHAVPFNKVQWEQLLLMKGKYSDNVFRDLYFLEVAKRYLDNDSTSGKPYYNHKKYEKWKNHNQNEFQNLNEEDKMANFLQSRMNDSTEYSYMSAMDFKFNPTRDLINIPKELTSVQSFAYWTDKDNGDFMHFEKQIIWETAWEKAFSSMQDKLELHEIAEGVLSNNASFYPEVLEMFQVGEFLSDIGSSIHVEFQPNSVEIDYFVSINDVIPKQKKSVTNSGKLIVKQYTDLEKNIIVQDYICSTIFRIANEFFSTLPINEVVVHALDSVISPSTGNYQDAVLISIIMTRDQFLNLNLQRIDPSQALESFSHNMKFTKSNGFRPIEKLKLPKSKIKSTSKKVTNKTEQHDKKETETIKAKSSGSISIRFSSSLTVKEIQNQFKELFDKKVIVLTPKGNAAGENRKLRALTDKDLKTEVIVPIEKLTKKALKEVKKITGIHIDY